MKKHFTKLYCRTLVTKALSLVIIALMGVGVSFAQLTGTNYTIDAATATGGTNFASFAAFKTALGSGVAGPVKVTVKAASGPYTETILFTAVSGASSTNTITIDGNGEKIQGSSNYVIALNGADYFTFTDLAVSNTTSSTSYNKCMWLYNSADNNTIEDCSFTMPNFASSNTASCYIGVMQSQSSDYTNGDPGQNNVINNNTFSADVRKGPFAGITVVNEGRYNYTIHKITITNNDIKDWYQSGVYANYVTEVNISNNKIHNTGSYGHIRGTSTNKYGVYYRPYYKSVGNSTISNNTIVSIDSTAVSTSYYYAYGIYVYGYYARGKRLDVSNNEIDIRAAGKRYYYGIYNYGYRSSFTDASICNGNKIRLIHKDASTSNYNYVYGIFNFGAYYNQTVDTILCNRNDIKVDVGYGGYGIYNYGYYTNTKKFEVNNNLINVFNDGYGACYYGYSYQQRGNMDFYNNTLNNEGWTKGTFSRTSTFYVFYDYYGRGSRRNNMFSMSNKKTGGTKYLVNNGNPQSVTFRDNNLWIKPGTPGTVYYGYYNTSQNRTFANWTSAAGSASTTTNLNPQFVDASAQTLIPTNPNMVNAGVVLSTVTDDVYGTVRSTSTPDIGAIEFFLDIAVTKVTITGFNECAGYDEDVTITLKNNSDFTMPFLSTDIYKDGIMLGSAQTSSPVASGKSADVTFNVVFAGNGTQIVEGRVGGDDDLTNNSNTASIDIFAAPSGGEFSKNSGSGAMHNMLGTFDVTIVPNGLIYDVTSPSAYTNADYSSGWMAKVKTTYASGTPVASGDAATWTAPSGSTDGMISIMPTSTVIDSLLTISLRVYNVTSGCDTIIKRDVLIAPEGVPGFMSPVVNCANDPVAFDNTSTVSTGSLTYEWDFGDSTDNSLLTHPIHKYAAPGTYNVKLTTTTQPWEYKNSITIPITVTAVPEASFTRLNACEGSDITLTNTSTGGTNYTWNFGDLGKADVYTKDAKVQYTPGGYTVTLTAEANGCSGVITKPVYQFAMPVAAFTNTSGACNTDEFTFLNGSTISDGSVGYTWDFDDMNNGNALLSTNENPTIMFTNPGDHNVKLTAVSEFGCENSTTQTVGVKEGPAVSFTYSGGCSEEATVFTNGTTFPTVWNANHKWNFGDGSAVSGDVNPTHNWNTTGDLDVTLTVDLDNGCSGMQTQTIKVAPQPVADFSVNDECVGSNLVFANNSTWKEGNITFTWDFDGAIIGGTNDIAPKGVAMAAGTYDVKLIAKVSEGCSNEVTKTVTISEAPLSCDIVATEDHANGFNGYKFESAIGSTVTTESNVTYYWVIENHGNRTGSSVNVDFQEEGDFTVSLTAINDNTGCECTSSMNHNNVGIGDDLTAANNFVVYPNPANSKLTIEMESGIAKGVSIELINAVGATVMLVDSKNIVDGKVSIDVSDLASGLYLVRITSGQTISTKKISIID